MKNPVGGGPAIRQAPVFADKNLSAYEVENYERIQFYKGMHQGYREAYNFGKFGWEHRPEPLNIAQKIFDYTFRIEELE